MLKRLTTAQSAGATTALGIGLAYGAVPAALYLAGVENPYLLSLAQLAAAGAIFIYLGSKLPVLDGLLRQLPRVRASAGAFLVAVGLSFVAFVVVASVTSEGIPLLASLQGADSATIAALRERFLKAREGWQASLVYINAFLAGALVPYALMLMQLARHKYRWWALAAFLVYCTSFAEKAFFLKAAVPLLYLVAQGRATKLRPGVLVGAMLLILGAVTLVSGVGSSESGSSGGEFFSTSFSAVSPATFLVWRAFAVPIITATDALRLFEEQYAGRWLLGASSSLLAALFGQERVSVERDVFAAQWGQLETETGSANSVYLTEAYLNFGLPGVIAFSLLIGLSLRIFARSRDEAFRSLWPLFSFSIFVSGLLGTFFSNGFALVICLALLTNFGVERYAGAAEDPGRATA